MALAPKTVQPSGFDQFQKASEQEDFSQFSEAPTAIPESVEKLELSLPVKAAQGFNVGLAKFGLLVPPAVDLVNFGLSFIGLGAEEPVGGSKSVQRAFHKAGAAPEPGKEREELGKVGRITEEIGAAVGPAGAVSTAVRLGKEGGMILKPVFDFFRAKPLTAVTVEATSAAGAGTGAVIAEEVDPGNPITEMILQLVGGIVSSPTLIAELLPSVIAKFRQAGGILFTKEGAKDTAAQIVQKSARDLEGTISKLKVDAKVTPGAKLTVGQETGDPGLLSLERSAMNKSEELKDGVAEAITQSNRVVTDELLALRGEVSPDALRVTLSKKVDYIIGLMKVRANQAIRSASDKLSKLAPDLPREKANQIVRKELDDAYDAGRTQEGDLWKVVPKEVKTTIDGTRERFATILKARDRRVDDPEDIPAFVRGWFKGKRGIKGDQTIGRVQSMRSRVLKEMRAERGKEVPNRNKVRILGEVADSLLDDMALAAGDEVALARAFSRDFNQRFTQGTVGDLLGFSKTGEPSTAAALTLERTIGKPRTAGGVAAEDIASATGVQVSPTDTGFENVQAAARDFIADKFISKFPSGAVSATAGKRFLSENREVLAHHPELKADIEAAIKSQEVAERLIARQAQTTARLKNKNKTAAAVFLDAPVNREIKKVLAARNPQANMKSLVARAAKDETGQATKGLKAGVIDEVFAAGTKRGGRDLDLRETLDGEAMLRFLKTNKRGIIDSGVFSPDEVKRLEQAIDTAVKAQRRALSGFPGQEILDESPDAFTDMVLSVVGANIGGASAVGQASGAPLVLAGRTASAARNFGRKWLSKIPAGKVREILNEAILNRELMLELLKKPKTIQQAIEQHKALRGFLFNIVPESFSEPITIEITQDDISNEGQ